MEPVVQDKNELIRAALQQDDAQLRREVSSIRAADIADSFHALDDEERSRLLFALPARTAAEVVILLEDALRSDVVEEMPERHLAGIVAELAPDDAADVLGGLTDEQTEQILSSMPNLQSEQIGQLLGYDESSAGGIMTTQVVAVPANKTVRDAVEDVRNATHDEELHEIYVIDEDRKLIGTVPIRRLVTNPPETRLDRICDRDVVAVDVHDDQEAVLQVIRKYDVSTVAVVDANRHLLGQITHDDLQDVAEEEAEEDLLRMAGTDPAELDTTSPLRAAKVRLTWLLPCMMGMLISSVILALSKQQFQDLILFTTLVLFVPMIGAMGGNCGVQISTIIVRGIAIGDVSASTIRLAVRRELPIALLMAPTCGLLAWTLAAAFIPLIGRVDPDDPLGNSGQVALSVGLGMTVGILVAAGLGIVLPFLFRRLKIDPAIASGPIVTTTNDFISVGIYMLIALWVAA